MATPIASELSRGQSGAAAFPLASQNNIKIGYVIVPDFASLSTIETWRRFYGMIGDVIGGQRYRLEIDLTTWTPIGTGTLPSNVVTEDEIFDMDGYIQASLIKNLFINDSFVVASEAAMLALNTVTGNAIIRTDTGQVFIKLNNDSPSDISDFADITANTGAVTSVNGQTGAVSITIANLLAVAQNVTDFQAAVSTSSAVTTQGSAISTLQSQVLALQNAVSAITGANTKSIFKYDPLASYVVENYVIGTSGGGALELFEVISNTTPGKSPYGVDAATYYKKVGDYYTKAETDSLLEEKADLVSGKVPLSQIPTSELGLKVFPDIAARDAFADKYEGMRVLVIDATADPAIPDTPVISAEYVYSPDDPLADISGFIFINTGGQGGIDGSTGVIDNRILRADGTGGSTLQTSLVSIDDTGNIVLQNGTYVGNSASTALFFDGSLQFIGLLADTLTNINLDGLNDVIDYSSGRHRFITKVSNTDSSWNVLFRRQTSGTHAVGIGSGLSFVTETAVANEEIGSTIESISTNIGSGAEAFDLRFSTMTGGAIPTERLRIKSTGQLQFNGYTTATTYTGTPVGYLQFDSAGNIITAALPADVVGPASATDNAVARFDLATGKLIQNSSVIIDDLSNVTLGTSSLSGTERTITVNGSGADIDLYLTAKGTGSVFVLNTGGGRFQSAVLGSVNNQVFYAYDATTFSNAVTPAAGYGVGIRFLTDTQLAGNTEIGSIIESVSTNVGSGTEAFDLVFKTMTGGAAAAERLRVSSTVNTSTSPFKVPSYTVAGVPSASATGSGTVIFISNESGGAVLAFSDGTDWRRVTDRAVIS